MAIFQFWKMAAAILNFEIFEILTVGTLKRVKLRDHAKFSQNRSNRCGHMTIFRYFFQYDGRPPSWICCMSDRTTREGRFVVFITVQNSVGIDAVVSMICKF